MVDYSISKLKNDLINNGFVKIIQQIFISTIDKLRPEEKIKLLELALVLINSKNEELFNFGYFIILNYSIDTNDYKPLYEISDKLLNFPINKFLIDKGIVKLDDNVFNELNDIMININKVNNNYYHTAKQRKMNKDFFEEDQNIMVVAPTSFGKTELIKRYIKENYKNRVICIIEPTKTMLNQVKQDLLKEFKIGEIPKIITHYDMNFQKTDKLIFVMTQERLFKLMYDKKTDVKIDTLLIDEAHNIFEKSERAFLLAKVIYLLRNKNNELIVKYFSPIIQDSSNLKIKKDINDKIKQIKVNPKMKVEKFFYVDFFKKEKSVYNQFFNEFYLQGKLEENEKYCYIIKNANNKNLIYINRPKDIKTEIIKISKILPENNNIEIEQICKNISDYINEDYDLIDCIKKGIVYHFGVMPENVRSYIENCVKNEPSLKYIFCTSTLLEGVNMPFDKLFILDIKKGNSNLTYHQLKNLIGRVNRYKNIFDYRNKDLKSLVSEIHFIKEMNSNSSFETFIKDNLKTVSNSSKRKDIIKNKLLLHSEEELSKEEESKIENLKSSNINNDLFKIKTKTGKLLLELNINDFDIFKYEEIIEKRITDIKNKKFDNIVDKIYEIFIKDIEINSENLNTIKRLDNKAARNFYNMIINWRKNNLSISESIKRLSNYWQKLNRIEKKYIYVGRAFGEIKRNETDRIPLYVNLNTKTEKEIINLAIIRIKEENDYIDYNLFKYIDFLYKYELLEKSEYELIHYGTDNEIEIFFQKDGLSKDLTRILIKKYNKYLQKYKDIYIIDQKIFDIFDENEILKFELKNYLNIFDSKI